MNEMIILIIIAISMLTIFILYRLFDKLGLFFSLVILNIATFILTFKITAFLKLNINLGIVTYISVLSNFYIFLIKYGKKGVRELKIISLYTNILTAIFLVIMNYYIPMLTETISINIKNNFIYNYKILIAYPIVMYLSQYLTIKLYTYVSDLQVNRPVCILLTYIITAPIYTIIFYLLSYINVLNIKNSAYIGMSSYIAGLIVTIINIIFIYSISKSKKVIK